MMTIASPARRSPVEERAGADVFEALIEEARLRARRRRWIYGLVAAGLVVCAAAVIVMRVDPSSSADPASAGNDPSAATVSGQGSGELVAAVGKIHDGAWYLYADGRLISIDDWGDGRPGGFVEQRLTAEGVERVRSEFLASGLFHPSRGTRSDVPSAREDTPQGRALVREGDRLLIAPDSPQPPDHSLTRCPSDDVPGTKCHLVWYLRGLESSLPPDEWADQQRNRYVSVRYALCLNGGHDTQGRAVALTDVSSAVAQLPPPAPQLLEDRRPTGTVLQAANSCFDLTIDEARSVSAALLGAYTQAQTYPGIETGTYEVGAIAQMKLESTIVNVHIELWPALPAGGLAMWGG